MTEPDGAREEDVDQKSIKMIAKMNTEFYIVVSRGEAWPVIKRLTVDTLIAADTEPDITEDQRGAAEELAHEFGEYLSNALAVLMNPRLWVEDEGNEVYERLKDRLKVAESQ